MFWSAKGLSNNSVDISGFLNSVDCNQDKTFGCNLKHLNYRETLKVIKI